MARSKKVFSAVKKEEKVKGVSMGIAFLLQGKTQSEALAIIEHITELVSEQFAGEVYVESKVDNVPAANYVPSNELVPRVCWVDADVEGEETATTPLVEDHIDAVSNGVF